MLILIEYMYTVYLPLDSIVNLNCIYDRKVGNPEWLTASDGKEYPTGERMCA